MSMRVVVGRLYRYKPVMFDQLYRDPQGKRIDLQDGDVVTVIDLHNCPTANTMGMCYVEKGGEFKGMVCCNSLQPIDKVAECFA